MAEVLASRRFEFCHKPEYPLTPFEKQWCDLGAGANRAACPTLAEACKREAQARQFEQDEPLTIKLPKLGLPLRVILWILLAIALALLLFALIRHFLDHEVKDVIKVETAASQDEEQAAALAREVETDVQRLLERARAEAAVGDFRAAVGSAYAALLRRLEGSGVIHVEADQTNGDYLGMVKRERPALTRRMSEVVDRVELAQFGHSEVTRDGFDGVWMRVTGLLSEHVGVLLVAFLGLLLSSACGQPRGDWEHSPSGRAGVIAYLGKRGFTVRERLLSVAKLGESKAGENRSDGNKEGTSDESKQASKPADQLVLLPGAQLEDDDWKAIKKWIDDGGRSLVIAGGRRKLPAWVGVRVLEAPAAASAVIIPDDADAKRWGALKARVPGGHRVEGAAGWRSVLRKNKLVYASELWIWEGEGAEEDWEGMEEDAEGAADEAGEEEAYAEESWSRVLVLADDYLFRNASLLVADNAMVLDAILRDGGTSIELAGDLTGLVSSNPIQSVARGRLGPALLQLAAFIMLLFVCKGARFGRPIASERADRREFAEHVGALGLHYARAHAERVALGALGAYVIERLRDRVGLRVDRSLSGLAEAVASRTDRPVGEVMRMFLEARDAGKGVPADKDARDLETAWQMCKLLEETGGTGGHKRIQSHV